MNARLSLKIEEWCAIGRPPQEGFDWSSSLNKWVAMFPNQEKFLAEVLPPVLDRTFVRGLFESSKYDIIDKFLSVMVWGYGDRGYGPYRVGQMLSQSHAVSVLTQVIDLAQRGDPKGAYSFLKENRIKVLGPSYGTKLLSFCTPRSVGSPIYDSFIAKWIDSYAAIEFEGIQTSSERWNIETYSKYLDWIRLHADKYGCFPDEIELVLFRDAESSFSKNSAWNGK